MREEIQDFISENNIATLCCLDEHQKPYCFNCFYVFDPKQQLLLFKSSEHTFHAQCLSINSEIAGSILPQKINLAALKGIQFTGKIYYKDFPLQLSPTSYYHKKNPLALAKSGKVWCIQLLMVKMTDSTKVFGSKLIWKKTQ